ncbi:hypothetical protein [Pseudoalteromonas piratica]|uniref:hypothetical protein n=1 Tax=Pseudoalteromonas piratica TaxID=1348114 RepID=UPI000691AED0|nr:hypothetical protein [Pseudoalteromonas piratica]
MKFILPLILSILFSFANAASAKNSNHQHKARVGLHGMLLFSDGHSLYASHLPMFHTPHDIQLIVRFELANKTNQIALKKALTNKRNYWTLAPERFDLNQLANTKKEGIWQFTADFYVDHFERGGKRQFSQQQVIVKEVIFRQQLNTLMPQNIQYVRLTPDNVSRQFYARVIEGKPGVDHLFWVNTASKLAKEFSVNAASDLLNDQTIATLLKVNPNSVHNYYIEHSDLK